MGVTKIEWCDRVWNPLTGCTPLSAGCANCYAQRMARRLAGRCGYPPEEPFRVTFHPDRLDEPLRWRKASRVFVCSMGDLFHEDVELVWLEQIYKLMRAATRHTFFILTKRPRKMQCLASRLMSKTRRVMGLPDWFAPADHIWLGVSCENQAMADGRVPLLVKCRAARRFLSLEPLLGPISLDQYDPIDWVIVGGESGPGARDCNLDWIRSIVGECRQICVPVFVKQLGSRPLDCRSRFFFPLDLHHSQGADPKEWPKDLRVREFPVSLFQKERP